MQIMWKQNKIRLQFRPYFTTLFLLYNLYLLEQCKMKAPYTAAGKLIYTRKTWIRKKKSNQNEIERKQNRVKSDIFFPNEVLENFAMFLIKVSSKNKWKKKWREEKTYI